MNVVQEECQFKEGKAASKHTFLERLVVIIGIIKTEKRQVEWEESLLTRLTRKLEIHHNLTKNSRGRLTRHLHRAAEVKKRRTSCSNYCYGAAIRLYQEQIRVRQAGSAAAGRQQWMWVYDARLEILSGSRIFQVQRVYL